MAAPLSPNEFDRLIHLTTYDFDYLEIEPHFKDLSKLAAQIAGASISMINIIDSYNVWTVGSFNCTIGRIDREDTICQYTLNCQDYYEIKSLSVDSRFKSNDYITNNNKLEYYLGVPLKTENGFALGVLCILDQETKEISKAQIEMLKSLASIVVNQLNLLKTIRGFQKDANSNKANFKRIMHDIRNPISGILGLSNLIEKENASETILKYNKHIQQTSESLLELSQKRLKSDSPLNITQKHLNEKTTLAELSQQLLNLYSGQALSKNVALKIYYSEKQSSYSIPKIKIIQIAGNLISNAIKFSNKHSIVETHVSIIHLGSDIIVRLIVQNEGIGLYPNQIEDIKNGVIRSTIGNNGEAGFGLGLQLVKHLLNEIDGTLYIESIPQEKTKFMVEMHL